MIAPAISAREFRTAMGRFATGITVVTTGSGSDIHAMTANAITSVSLDPPLLLFCVAKTARMADRIRQNGHFTVNILNETQADLSSHFAGRPAGDRSPAFTFLDWSGGSRLAECAAALSCSLYTCHDGGDHWIVLGQVQDIHQPALQSTPLLFYRGQYHRLAPVYEAGRTYDN